MKRILQASLCLCEPVNHFAWVSILKFYSSAVGQLSLIFGWALFGNPVFAEATQPESFSWAKHNRYIEAYAGSHNQDYQEQDTQGLTTNGVLDTETGNQDHIGLALRWQTSGGWLMQLQAQRQSGTTNYNGYLQSGGGSLTPYRATTGNVATQLAVQVGYALNSDNPKSGSCQSQ